MFNTTLENDCFSYFFSVVAWTQASRILEQFIIII